MSMPKKIIIKVKKLIIKNKLSMGLDSQVSNIAIWFKDKWERYRSVKGVPINISIHKPFKLNHKITNKMLSYTFFDLLYNVKF